MVSYKNHEIPLKSGGNAIIDSKPSVAVLIFVLTYASKLDISGVK